ncbi:Gfo/Idh/MocA family protein [Maritalea sp.]|jgi:predicted dehydrogenase|uniref:Gfo/Idh/MocA family protein n=1 Tax=Maritalea sp. TaxID=2003361 RepID=UPI0039E5271F
MAKLNWGIIGGGEGSQIGLAHRMCSALDDKFQFRAGAMDVDPVKACEYGTRLGLEPDRAYGSWQDMLAAEKIREDRLDLVTIATPNSTHFEITKAFLENGFNVLCEKPMTMTLDEAKEIVALQAKTGQICAVNYGYSGYPMVRQMREMVRNGDLGAVRSFVAEFSHGFHADAADADNPRVRWRYDPKQAGVSAQFADCGIHALHLASFVLGQNPKKVSADFAACVPGRELEDDALVALRMDQGAVGRLWSSSIAIGRMHGLTLQVFGEKGGLRWAQEQPNQLYWNPINQSVQILERGQAGLSDASIDASRLTIGHAEGAPVAFANIYKSIAKDIEARKLGLSLDQNELGYPTAFDGMVSMAAIDAAAKSATAASAWTELDLN